MQTNFSLAQLAENDIQDVEKIIRSCVHCGFCLATCPTYVLLGDERDSPRGRIYMIKEMLENERPASATITRHLDRCLSCLSCMTTCPSSVNYRKLVDHARVHIEGTFLRPIVDRVLRWWLAKVLPNPCRFRLALVGALVVRAMTRLLSSKWLLSPIKAMLESLPAKIHARSRFENSMVVSAIGKRRGRVALLAGCVQNVLAPQINESTVRLLTRHGIEVVIAKGARCCGALSHHLGRESEARRLAEANIIAWTDELQTGGIDAIVINAAGCGDMVKNYEALFPSVSPELSERNAQIASLACDISEYIADIGFEASRELDALPVAYQSACALQHGQKIVDQPRNLLVQAGFNVVGVPEGHMCCGSAGAYSLLQPEIAGQLAARKVTAISQTGVNLVATGNIGCMIQIARVSKLTVVHTAELLDWASGGPKPEALVDDTNP